MLLRFPCCGFVGVGLGGHPSDFEFDFSGVGVSGVRVEHDIGDTVDGEERRFFVGDVGGVRCVFDGVIVEIFARGCPEAGTAALRGGSVD